MLAVLGNQHFIALEATIVKKEIIKAVNFELEEKDPDRKFVAVTYNTTTRSAPSSD